MSTRRFAPVALIAALSLVPACSRTTGGDGGNAFASDSAKPIDGIPCEHGEHGDFHIHAHLAVFAAGKAQRVPQGIGIAPPRVEATAADGAPFVTGGSCFYWLHTHTPDGIIHIEAPRRRVFTLGQFFDVWGQPLGPEEAAGGKGGVTAYVDGEKVSGDPRAVELGEHRLIQLNVGKDVAPVPFTFPARL